MNIAICLHGQPRLYERGYININNFVEKNNKHHFDFFFHTWYDENMIGQYYKCAPWRYISKDELEIKKNTITNLINLFKPKEYKIESPTIFDDSLYYNTNMYLLANDITRESINNTISCFYSKYQVSKLLKKYVDNNNILYDFIVSIRFDFLNELNFFIEDMNKNVINCMNVNPRLYIADHLVIMNYDLFFKYSITYLNLLEIMNNYNIKEYVESIGCGWGLTNETLVTSNLKLYYDNLYEIIHMNNKIPNFI